MTLDALVAATARSLADYEGVETAVDFGDPTAEATALRAEVAAVPIPHRRILRARGSERIEFLQGQLTSDVAGLRNGDGQAATLLSAQGRVEAVVTLYDAGESIEIATDARYEQAVRERLERFLIADDVELESEAPPAACIVIAGPQAPALLAALGASSLDSVPSWRRSQAVLAGVPARILARGEYAVPFFELLVEAEAAAASWRALTEAGAKPAGMSALEILRVESGVARYGVDVDESRIALEARLEWAIHFSKGCYVGQEVIERAVSRGRLNRRLALLASDQPLPVGASVDGGGEREVVTSAVRSPTHGSLAFCYLDLERAAAGTDVTVGGVAARVLAWPKPEVYTGLRR